MDNWGRGALDPLVWTHGRFLTYLGFSLSPVKHKTAGTPTLGVCQDTCVQGTTQQPAGQWSPRGHSLPWHHWPPYNVQVLALGDAHSFPNAGLWFDPHVPNLARLADGFS